MTSVVRTIASGFLCEVEAIDRQLNACGAMTELYRELKTAIDDCLSRLCELGLWGPANQLPSSELWNIAGHLLSRGRLQNQARTKPRGYAGDYEMLRLIYESRLCDDPLGALFDQYFQEQAAPQAVRNRMALMVDWIVEAVRANTNDHFHIGYVGSALGLEIRDAAARLDDSERARIQVTLLDVDPAAIDFALSQLSPLLGADRLTAASTNLFRLPDRPAAAGQLKGANLIFCPGIFDYLDDSDAMKMFRCLFDQVLPGGQLTVFQFAPHNPTRAYMEWFGNWYLTYRNDVEFRALIKSAGLVDAADFGAEALGVDLFATLRRGL